MRHVRGIWPSQTDQRGQRFPLPNIHTSEARKEEAGHVRLETEARRSASEGRSLSKLPPDPPGSAQDPRSFQLRFPSNPHYFPGLYLASGKITLNTLCGCRQGEVRSPLGYSVVCYNML